MPEAINIGSIYADLDVNSGKMERGLAKGEHALKLIEAELRNLEKQLQSGAIDMGTYLARVTQLDSAAGSLALKMRQANGALGTQADALDILNKKLKESSGGMGGVGASASNLSMGMMQLGYVVDDLQYGFSAVVNNVAPMAFSFARAAGMATTSAAGLSAGLQLAAVAAIQFYNHWDQLLEVFGSGKVETEAEAMERLGKATRLTADEAERLARFKAMENKGKELRDAPTESEKKAEDVATKAMTEADIKHVRQGVIATAPELLDADAGVIDAKKALEEAKARSTAVVGPKGEMITADPGAIKAKEDAIAKARKDLIDARRAAAEKEITTAALPQFFRGAPGKFAALVKSNPAAFGPHANALQGGLEEAQLQADLSPEERQRDKVVKAVGKVWDAFKKDFGQAVDKLAKETEKDEDRRRKVEAAVEKEGRKANDAVAEQVWPQLKDMAERSAASVAKGTLGRDEAIGGLAHGLEFRGMGEADAREAARRAFGEANVGDPEKREEKLRRGREEQARKLGMGDEAEAVAALRLGGMGGVADARAERMKNELAGKLGLAGDEAEDLSSRLLSQGESSVRKRLANLALGRREEEAPSRSEVFATSQLTAKVQAGVGTDNLGKKVADNSDKQVELLKKLVDRRAVEIQVV